MSCLVWHTTPMRGFELWAGCGLAVLVGKKFSGGRSVNGSQLFNAGEQLL